MSSRDYWDLATLVELAVICEDEPSARRAVDLALRQEPPRWMRMTTISNLEMLREVVHANLTARTWLDEVIQELVEE